MPIGRDQPVMKAAEHAKEVPGKGRKGSSSETCVMRELLRWPTKADIAREHIDIF